MAEHFYRNRRKEGRPLKLRGVSRIAGAALFGSGARGDDDVLSDRDILLVADHAGPLNLIADTLDRVGWSCTPYTWKRLEKCIADGSLFGVHLRDEGLILKDADGRLHDVLNSWNPKATGYSGEFRDACALIAELEDLPLHDVGRAWALDVLMVGFRGAAVALLANEGLHLFSFRSILAQLNTMDLISHSERIRLEQLRMYKWAYRTGRYEGVPNFDDVRQLIDIVSRCFRLGLHPKPVSDEYITQKVLARVVDPESWYRTSRKAELAIQRFTPSSRAVGDFQTEKRALLHVLRNPTQYGGFLNSCWPAVRDRLTALSSRSVM